MKKSFFLLIISLSFSTLFSQEIYLHVNNKDIYGFLNEMANLKVIELNSVVKPYSRSFVARKLDEVTQHQEALNDRQINELNFYLRDFNKELKADKNFKKRIDLFYYKDSLFTISLNPILGIQYWNNENGSNFHRWNGIEAFSYIGKQVGAYGALVDNHEKVKLVSGDFLTTRPAARYKTGNDFSEMRGGITWAWNWGVIGLVKDRMEWGNYSYYPNIISGKAPSFTHIKLNIRPVKWLEFNYIHGWLASGLIDSARSYEYSNSYGDGYRTIYRRKFIAANMFTVTPLKHLNISIGNSIIYGDRGVNPTYLIPIFFYKSIDHTENTRLSNDGGQNSQLFLDISSRQIRCLHLFATMFFDDLSMGRLKKNGHFDYYSLKAGMEVSDLIPNTEFRFEYVQTYPLVYKHTMPNTAFESSFYTLGHYLQDNSKGMHLELISRLVRGLNARVYYDMAKRGPDHEELGTDRLEVTEMFLDEVIWESRIWGLDVQYQIINGAYIYLNFEKSTITGEVNKYTSAYYQNNPTTFSFGVNYGLN